MSIGNLVSFSSHGLFSSGGGGTCDYPVEANVVDGVSYAFGTMTGLFTCPSPPPPPSPAVAGTMPYALIERNIVTRVALALGMSTAFVRPVANDDYELTEFENLFAFIRSYGPSPVDATTGASFAGEGSGRWRTVVGRRVRIYIYTRSGIDSPGGDEIALQGSDPTQLVTTPPTMPGHFSLEEVVLNALHNWVITYVDVLGNTRPLTSGPLHWIDSAGGPPERKKENEVGLVRSHLDFQVMYELAVQKVEPAPSGLPTPNPGT